MHELVSGLYATKCVCPQIQNYQRSYKVTFSKLIFLFSLLLRTLNAIFHSVLLLHVCRVTHLFNNMSLFLLLSPSLEWKLSQTRYITIVLICTLVGAITNIVCSNYGLVGASGIVFMLLLLTPMVSAVY